MQNIDRLIKDLNIMLVSFGLRSRVDIQKDNIGNLSTSCL